MAEEVMANCVVDLKAGLDHPAGDDSMRQPARSSSGAIAVESRGQPRIYSAVQDRNC